MNIRLIAKTLVKESINEKSLIDNERVEAVCDYVQQNIAPQMQTKVLREYMKLLKPLLSQEEATVELSGDISDSNFDDIKNFVISATGRKDLRFTKVENKELLGGYRIKNGDTIWEYSVKSTLNTLRSTTGNF